MAASVPEIMDGSLYTITEDLEWQYTAVHHTSTIFHKETS
jgi:hypothetical protein